MDGGSADHAGAVICRPPWTAGVQITQERLSAAIAGDHANRSSTASVRCDFKDYGVVTITEAAGDGSLAELGLHRHPSDEVSPARR